MMNKIHTAILFILAAGTPVLVVVPEQYWFEKRVGLCVAALILLALLAAKTWTRGLAPLEAASLRPSKGGLPLTGWGLLGAAMVIAAAVPAGRVANLMAPELWMGLGAVVAYFAIKNTTTNSKMIKLGFAAAAVGVLVAAAVVAGGIGLIGPIGPIRFSVASGLGILGILGTLALVYQLGLKSVKGVFKSGSVWWRVLNLLVLVLLAGFLVLPNPALSLWPLAIAASLACGITVAPLEAGRPRRPWALTGWAVFVGALIVIILVLLLE